MNRRKPNRLVVGGVTTVTNQNVQVNTTINN